MAGTRLHGRKSLQRYEWLNLVLLLFAVVALTAFATWVFQFYSSPEEESAPEEGILSEVFTDSDVCMFTVGAKLTHTSRRFETPAQLLATDILARQLFGIPGIVEVSVNQKSVVLRKVSSVRWESIQPKARTIITDYIRRR